MIFFVLKLEIDFRELIRKKAGKGLFERDFDVTSFMKRMLTIM